MLKIVMPNTAYETGNPSKLLDQITSEFPHAHISTVNRKYFNEEKGVQQHCLLVGVMCRQFTMLIL